MFILAAPCGFAFFSFWKREILFPVLTCVLFHQRQKRAKKFKNHGCLNMAEIQMRQKGGYN